MLPAGVAGIAVLGTLTGVFAAAVGGPPGGSRPAGPVRPHALPPARPASGPVVPALGSDATVEFAGSTARLASARVAPLRRLLQADFLIVAPASLPAGALAAVSRQPGAAAAEQIEAVRMAINGQFAAVLGVNPSSFRSYAAGPTAKSDPLWDGVASGGIAVSYTMGHLDRLPLGGTVTAAGKRTEWLRVAAFGTMGIGGVDAVVSDSVARSLGMPSGNAIVVSARPADLTSLAAEIGRVVPRGASVEPLMTVVQAGGGTEVAAGAGSGVAADAAAGSARLDAMMQAALSRVGLPYVWGGSGPKVFDCSGLVQWSFAQAGIAMPRVAADQAMTGPAVPVSQLQPGDLLFYHTDPTAPGYISHVAIYLGRGWMEQAPQPGMNVEVVPADFGSQFAGGIQVDPRSAESLASGL